MNKLPELKEEWGYRKIVVTPETVGAKSIIFGLAVFESHSKMGAHLHGEHEEVLFVHKGQGILFVEGEKYEVNEGDILFIPIGAKHSVDNISDGELWLVYARAPSNEKGPK